MFQIALVPITVLVNFCAALKRATLCVLHGDTNSLCCVPVLMMYRVAQNKPDYSAFRVYENLPLTLVAHRQMRREKRNVHLNILRYLLF